MNNYIYRQLYGSFPEKSTIYDFYNPRDKLNNLWGIIADIFNKLGACIEYKGLESTKIYKPNLDRFLFTQGYAGIIEDKGELKCLFGTLQGEFDENYNYKFFRIDNPYAKINKTYKVGEDVAIIYNDSQHIGLMPLISKYAGLMVENELSIFLADIISRASYIITAEDSGAVKSADNFIEGLEAGKFSAILDEYLTGSLKTAPLSDNRANFTYFIELESFLEASLYNHLGINANKDQKRESLASEEVRANNQQLLPFIDDLYECRREGFKEVSRIFGVDIEPIFKGPWELTKNEQEEELKAETEESEEVEKDEEDENSNG